jgi:glutaredoxin-dependent peroxiredoxin
LYLGVAHPPPRPTLTSSTLDFAMTLPAVGTSAPEFSLTHQIGQPQVRLADAVAQGPVVLLFFPLAFSGVCTTEICAVAEDWSTWESLGAQVFGISIDSPFVNARFAESCSAPFPILSDFNREAATAYGVRNDDFFGMKGVANRAAFVIDGAGVIQWAWMSEDPSVLPDFEAIRGAVKAIG